MSLCCCCWSLGCYFQDSAWKDKVAVVTGGNVGIGFATASALAQKGMNVVIGCRSRDSGQKAASELQRKHKVKVSFIPLDLGSFVSVRKFVESFAEEYEHLDVLVNNAGVMAPPYSTTEEGYELQFGVNHLGHFLLSMLLLSVLKTAHGRIVNVSSSAHFGGSNLAHLPDYENGRKYDAWSAYSVSKQCNVLFTYELQHRLRGTGVNAMVCHPGVIRSGLWQHNQFFGLFLCKCPTDGAKPLIHCATSKDFVAKPISQKMEDDTDDENPKEQTGEWAPQQAGVDRYFVPQCCCSNPVATEPTTYNRKKQVELWENSIKWAKLSPEEIEKIEGICNSKKMAEEIDYSPSVFQIACAQLNLAPCLFCCF